MRAGEGIGAATSCSRPRRGRESLPVFGARRLLLRRCIGSRETAAFAVGVALGMAVCLSPASAEPTPISMMRLDTNRSGLVHRAELRNAVRTRFARIDADRTGKASAAGLRSFAFQGIRSRTGDPPLRGERPRLEFDAAGEIGFEELVRAIASVRFDRFVANGDGDLSGAKIKAADGA